MTEEITTKIALFKGKEIRKTMHNDEWWFVIADVVAALTESSNPAQYLKNIRNRDTELDSLFNPVDKGGVQIDPPLALPFSTAGGTQNLLCWNTEVIFRLIQSIPSSKAAEAVIDLKIDPGSKFIAIARFIYFSSLLIFS